MDEQWKKLSTLLHLPSTDKVKSWQGKIPDFEERLSKCLERDALQASRPAGCWCLGLGGGDEVHLPMVDSEVFEKYCGCLEGQQARKRDQPTRQESREKQHSYRISSLWKNSGIPSRFQAMTLDTSPLAQSDPNLIIRLKVPRWEGVDEDEEDEKRYALACTSWSGSYFFWGAHGVGKTGLAVGLAREVLTRGFLGDDAYELKRILFKTVPGMLSHFRSTYNSPKRRPEGWDENYEVETEASLLQQYTNPSTLLILDDMGAEQVRNTGWVEDRLYQVIGDRHDNEIPTIFTSNISLKRLAEHIGERICWRIVEMCGKDHIIQLQGPNLREI